MSLEIRRIIDEPDARASTSVRMQAAAFLERIHIYQPMLAAFITVADDVSGEQAARADAARADRASGALDGMVVAVKDDVDVAGMRCTVGSRFFADRVPTADALIAARLRAAGAVIIGKTNMQEFAYGATTQNPHYGSCRNPWDLERIPGGSSGGSAVAVAADLCIGAIGSDAGGSVRIPAALNGICGFRPTLGSVSSRGAYTLSPTTEVLGPMARSVCDVARIFDVVSGYDERDPLSIEHAPMRTLATLDDGLRGLVVGIPRRYFFDDTDSGVASCVQDAADTLARGGAEVCDVELPDPTDVVAAVGTVLAAEALAIHRERLMERPELFGDDVARRLRLGEAIAGVDFAASLQRMREWRVELDGALAAADVLLTPTARTIAPRIDDVEMIATTTRLNRNTWPFSVAGTPGLSVPCGFAPEGLPVGLHIAARRWHDGMVLRVGAAYQELTDWHRRRSPALDTAAEQSTTAVPASR